MTIQDGSHETLSDRLIPVKCLLVVQILIKFNSYLRVYEKLGLLVNLLTTCIIDIRPFTFYMFIWMETFVVLFMILDVEAPTRDGISIKNGEGLLAMSLFIWENSIGNINDPTIRPN